MSILRRNNVQLGGAGARAMVFAHGFGCDHRMWRQVAPQFEKEFRTVLFDHVGSGLSDRSAYSTDRYSSLRGYARDIVELVGQLGCGKAVFVGHSCGAIMGALASIEAPELFESLILISPSPRYIDDVDYIGGFSRIEVERLLAALSSDFAAWSADMAPIFMGNGRRPELAQELLQSFQQNDPVIAAQFARAIFTSDFRSDLPLVSAQCLIFQCEQDPVVPVSVGEYMFTHLKNSRLQLAKIEGHFPHLSAPDRVVDSIRRFVSSPYPTKEASDTSSFGQVLNFPTSAGAKSGAFKSARRAEDRAELEDILLRRVGELHAHFGRYDMYALAIESWLKTTVAAEPSTTAHNLRSRGGSIKALLQRKGVPAGTIAQYELIDSRSVEILDKHDVAARSCAVIPVLSLTDRPSVTPTPRDWYDYAAARDEDIIAFIWQLERDTLEVASLYIRLADWASLISE
jgi:sigma-B regulation protein RsbQ